MKGAPVVPFQTLYLEPSRNGLMRPKRVRGVGFKMINMGELFAHDRIKNPPMDLVPMSPSEIERFGVRQWDLLFARQSLVAEGAGKCSIVLQAPEITTFESHLIRVRLNPLEADPLFYYYYFQSPAGKGNVQSIVMQVAAAGIRASELATLHVPRPDLPQQRHIASILSAYDDLIDNNTRRIVILEEMARRIYEEWFVRFRFPGHEGVRMVESESGLLPEGWRFAALGEVSGYISRGLAPKYDDDASFIVINQKCIRGQRLNLDAARRQSKPVPADKAVRLGDVLVNSTGVGTLGRVAQVLEPIDHCTVDTHVSIVRPGGECDADYFGLTLLAKQAHFEAQGVGSTGQTELSRARIAETELVVPPLLVQRSFARAVRPMRLLTVTLENKNRNLRTTRDLLLPKLISGELDVSAKPEPEAVAA